jgi:hypothetical protein
VTRPGWTARQFHRLYTVRVSTWPPGETTWNTIC